MSLPLMWRVAGVAVIAWAGCGEECPAERCPTTPPVLLKILDNSTGMVVKDAEVTVDGATNAVSTTWCNDIQTGVDCSHAVVDLPGSKEKRRPGESSDPGHGPYLADVELTASLEIASKPTSTKQAVNLRTNECGVVVPKFYVVRLSAAGGTWTPAATPPLRICK